MRKLILLLITVFVAQTSWSAPINQRQALEKARKFLTAHGISLPAQAKGIRAPQASTNDKSAPWYAFNGNGNGFVIVSGDDRTEPILGYSLTGSFSLENAPENLKAFLQGYTDEITWLQKNNITVKKSPTTRATTDRATIAPMLQTRWDQGSPYNNACPYFFSQVNGRCVTGCVATAMAQVLYYQYQQHPDRMVTATQAEIPAYQCYTNWTGYGRVSVDAVPAGSNIDWRNMLPAYTSDASEEQQTAVANLMAWCGAAVSMNYANSVNGGSSASDASVPDALIKYFGFDASTKYVSRDAGYTTREWNDLVYNELSNGRVVLYGGQSAAESGHAFVINGYEGNNFFDVDWGWGGMSDGAYLLSVLSPDDTGTGAGTVGDGYNYGQDMIINAEPDHGGTASLQAYALNFAQTGDILSYNIQNLGAEAASFDYGYGSIASDGTISVLGRTLTTPATLEQYSYFPQSFALLNISSLPNGTYNIVPIAKLTTQDVWQSLWTGHSINVTVSNGTVTYLNANEEPSLTASSLTASGNLVAGRSVTVTTTVSNSGNGDFEGLLYLFASTNSSKGYHVAHQVASVTAGASSQVTVNWTPTAAGTYNLWLCSDEDGNNVLASASGIVIEEGNGQYALSLISMTVNDEIANTETTDADGRIVKNVSGNNLIGSYTIRANQAIASWTHATTFISRYNEGTGVYDDYTTTAYSDGISYYSIGLPAGASTSLDFSFYNLPDGKYIIRPEIGTLRASYYYYYMSPELWYDDSHAYIINTSTGIDGVTTNHGESVIIYNINGMKVATADSDNVKQVLNTLPTGLYIVNGKKIVNR